MKLSTSALTAGESEGIIYMFAAGDLNKAEAPPKAGHYFPVAAVIVIALNIMIVLLVTKADEQSMISQTFHSLFHFLK